MSRLWLIAVLGTGLPWCTASAQEQTDGGQPVVVPTAVEIAEPVEAEAPGAPKRLVYPLKHTPAADVANTINDLLRSEKRPSPPGSGAQVLVLVEPVTNSLVISATPEDCDELIRLIEQLDRRPKMVSLQVTIAEVTEIDAGRNGDGRSTSTAEAPNRPAIVGLPGDSQFSTEWLQDQLASGAVETSSAEGNGDGEDGGHPKRLEVVSRAQLTTLDSQSAMIQIGQREPVVRGSQISRVGRVNNVTMEEVGLMIGLTPRIADGGLVTMEIDVEESRLGPLEDGVTIAGGEDAPEVRTPRIITTTLQSTVCVADGQTAVLGGLVRKSDGRRVDLLVFVTPRIVSDEPETGQPQ